MHTHTAPCSRCAVMTPAELCEALHEGGFAGAVLTNHFFGGNTGIDRTLPWEKFVGEYEKDYLACKDEAKKYDLDILFGIEEHISEGKEILIYGITPDTLYAHPDLLSRDYELWKRAINEAGGLVIQAHPFRERAYIKEPGALPCEVIDGIEVHNVANADDANQMAEEFAAEHSELILTSGADTHSAPSVTLGGIEFTERVRTERQLATMLRRRAYRILK